MIYEFVDCYALFLFAGGKYGTVTYENFGKIQKDPLDGSLYGYVRYGERVWENRFTLGVLNDIRILGEYTIQICKSEKVFPKSSRWVMAKPIVDECVSALTCVRRANAVFVQTKLDYEYRRNQQVQAHSHLDAMLSLVDLAYNSFSIESKRIEYWTGLILKADDRLKAWMKSDKERYKNIG